MRVRTLPELFQRAVHEHGPRTALRYHRDGDWHPITYGQLGRLVEEAALGLVAAGVDPGDTVAIEARPGPQAAVAELAALHAGARVLALPADDEGLGGESLAAARPRAAFVTADGRAREAWPGKLSSLETLIVLEATPGRAEADLADEHGAWTMTRLYREGQQRARQGADVEEHVAAIGPDQAAHLAPGREGDPRVLSHERVLQQAREVAGVLDLAPGHACLSLTGLADPLHRTAAHHALLHRGGQAWLSSTPERVLEDLQACRPELFLAPSEVYASIRQDLADRLEASQPSQRRLFAWARSVGEDRRRARAEEDGPGLGLRARHWVADRLVLGKARAALGLENLQAALVAGWLPAEEAAWLHSLGLPLAEALAPAELGLVVSLDDPSDPRAGSQGRPLPGVDVRVRDERIEVRAGSAGEGWIATGRWGRRDAEGRVHARREPSSAATEP